MRVNSVGQENSANNGAGIVKAGAAGALAGGLVSAVAPLTTEEYADFFTSSAKEGIKKSVQKARSLEADKISEEIAGGKLNIVSEAADKFKSAKDVIVDEPKKALDIVENSADTVKNDFKALVNRVDKAGIVKQRCETHAIKSAAKGSRSIGYFALAGALVAMCAKVLYNAANPKPKAEKSNEPKEPLTMADALLEGLGTNTEILILTSEARK
ncbi:MAG: hypothetical protein LUE64_00150 [Candidatus Gastranaerophilales bacterium]|nr:hypothetical protein [Candidatus Gastranaerophilales bacterium]